MEYVGGGVDYNFGSYTFQFNVGVTSVPFNVSINNDNILEDDEMFNLHINTLSLLSSVTIGDHGQTTVTIVANDGKHKVIHNVFLEEASKV